MDAMSAPGAGTKGIGGSRQLPCPASRSPLTSHTLLGLTCLNGPQKTSELFVCNKMVNTLKVKSPETLWKLSNLLDLLPHKVLACSVYLTSYDTGLQIPQVERLSALPEAPASRLLTMGESRTPRVAGHIYIYKQLAT